MTALALCQLEETAPAPQLPEGAFAPVDMDMAAGEGTQLYAISVLENGCDMGSGALTGLFAISV